LNSQRFHNDPPASRDLDRLDGEDAAEAVLDELVGKVAALDA
jgi:hypothetical protein